MSSRFFQRAGSSDESSSGSESESDSEIDQKQEQPKLTQKRSMFLKGGDDSDSSSESDRSEDYDSDFPPPTKKGKKPDFSKGAKGDLVEGNDIEKTIVKSAKGKRLDEMRQIVKSLNNGKKIQDWNQVQNEFDKLTKLFLKSSNLFPDGAPRFFIRALCQLEDSIKSAAGEGKDARKKMNATIAKALNSMKQKLKKYIKDFEKPMEEFRKDPVEEEDSESDVEDIPLPTPKRPEVSAAPVVAEDKEDKEWQTIGEKGKVEISLTPEGIFKKLKELIGQRGKKSTDRYSMIKHLRKLLDSTKSPYQKARVLLALIPAEFDYTSSTLGYMAIDLWKTTASDISLIMELVELNHNILVKDGVEEPEDDLILDKTASTGGNVELLGNIGSFVDRLDEEFKRSLQNIDPHTSEYIDRLKDESFLYGLIVRSQSYYMSKTGENDILAYAMVMMRRPENVVKIVEEAVALANPKFKSLLQSESPVESICVELYNTSNDRIRTRALLCHVYHLALHNKFYQARDLLLMSHLQETVQHTDVETQILYNRAMVQLGLCAFRAGLIRETTYGLQDISASGKVKELLAQGSSARFGVKEPEKSIEQEKLEKQRQLPFHQHINLELLECVYLTSSMLLEIPNMAMNVHDSRRKVISKPFRRMLDYNERQVFIGPPENTRDHIMGAAKAMAAGEWKAARDLIVAIKIWDILPNAEQIKMMLEQKIQEESLRTYLFTFSRYYDSINAESMCERFTLEKGKVVSIIFKMIASEELCGWYNESSETLIFEQGVSGVEISRLEYLASSYSDKVATFVENNEKLMEAKIADAIKRQGKAAKKV